MKLLAFAVHDEKAEAFMRPFFVAAVGQAIRLFTDEAGSRESEIGKHPGDYRLYRIGSYDDRTATLEWEQPVLMSSGTDVLLAAEPLRVAK